MSDLPTTNNQDTVVSLPSSEAKVQQLDAPDLSNPYIYLKNSSTNLDDGSAANINVPLKEGSTSFNEMYTATDPEILKLKSSFWKRAGKFQSAIGSMTGLESWQTSGHKVEEEAEREYKEAERRLGQGEPSRLHGEYDRLMGYVTYAVGHVAGDTDMQTKANERSEQGEAEINKISRS